MSCLRTGRSIRPVLAGLGIFVYAYAALVAPALHARHHALHGADHRHGVAGMAPLPEETHATSAHASFHEDVDALALGDVATAGALDVDCALSRYTLTECGEATHAPHFGDAIIAHQHERTPPVDPSHGQGALEHLQAAIVPTTPIVLPPPSLRFCAAPPALVEAQRTVPTPRTHAPRGPPASLI